ncbi:hypothetical protein ABNF65_17275 [Paenibacillus larvae]|nr:hypothetical protein [Paenibacillus larvae]
MMERQEMCDQYLRSLKYYIWISELSPERKKELFEEYRLAIETKANSALSDQSLRTFLAELGNPKDIVKKEMKGIEGFLSPSPGKFKRGMGFIPYIFTISWTLNTDLYRQMATGQLQASFWLHASIILLLVLGTIFSFYQYRYDQSLFKEIAFTNFIVYLPLSLIFCYMLLQQFSIGALLIPFLLIVLTTVAAFYFDWKNSTFMRQLFIP